MRKELHIAIGCADARDLNTIQVDVINEKIQSYYEKGIDIDFHVIRAAGSFVTRNVFEDIYHIILEYQRENDIESDTTDYFIHIQTHGHLTKECNHDYVSHIYEMQVVDGSNLNCGMLGATGLAVEIEQMLVQSKLSYEVSGQQYTIEHDDDICTLLKLVYAHEGYLAGDWIKSIDYLRTHPRTQRSILSKMIHESPSLSRLGIQITAGIQDYSIHSLIRVDGGVPQVAWWDDVQLTIREKVKDDALHQVLDAQSEKQAPLAGLLCTADPKTTSRTSAANYYLRSKGVDSQGKYLPNTIFNISSANFDVPNTPFGSYTIAGFYFAVVKLGLKDQMILGKTAEHTKRMLRKIKNDPIMNLIVNKFNVNLIALNQQELDKHYKHTV